MYILIWSCVLLGLICISAFFSGSETGMMSVNYYKVRHAAKRGNKSAPRVLRLLKRPDRLLGMILIGNTVANILATSVATMLAVKYYGELGLVYVTFLLSVIILVFAETIPKTVSALYAEKVAYAVSIVLVFLLKIFSPVVWLINTAANSILRIFGIKGSERRSISLSVAELETIVSEATNDLDKSPRNMLLRMLSLEDVVVEDVMVARADVIGIDMTLAWHEIMQQILHTTNMFVPVYNDNIDNVLGILNVRAALVAAVGNDLNKESLLTMLEEVYFIPEATPIDKQLVQFQQKQQRIGLVVDEYGEILGLLTIKDILEEIVGEFDDDEDRQDTRVVMEADGSYVVDAGIYVRELHRLTEWKLPLEGAATLSGLIIEHLQYIPSQPLCVKIAGYPMEIMAVDENTISEVRVWPRLYREAPKPDY